MIARDINVSFYIFSLLKYDRIFGKSLEHDTYERVKKILDSALCGGSDPGLASDIYISFLFLWHI